MARRIGLKLTPLDQVEKLLRSQRTNLVDRYLPLSKIRLEIGDPLGPMEGRYRVWFTDDSKKTPYTLTENSLRQLCNLAGIPPQFLDRVPPAMGLSLVRGMLEAVRGEDGKPLLFRLRHARRPMIRAVLPQSHVRLADLDVLDEVKETVQRLSARAVRVVVAEDLFLLRLVFDEGLNVGTQSVPDNCHGGFDVVSSETGRYPLTMRHVLFRVVCGNGMTVDTQREQTMRARYTRMDRDVFRDTFKEALATSLTEVRRLAGLMAETRSTYIADPEQEMRDIFQRFDLGSPRGRLFRFVNQEVSQMNTLFGVSRFDLVQGFTATARDLEHRDRMKLEDAMGEYVLSPATSHVP